MAQTSAHRVASDLSVPLSVDAASQPRGSGPERQMHHVVPCCRTQAFWGSPGQQRGRLEGQGEVYDS